MLVTTERNPLLLPARARVGRCWAVIAMAATVSSSVVACHAPKAATSSSTQRIETVAMPLNPARFTLLALNGDTTLGPLHYSATTRLSNGDLELELRIINRGAAPVTLKWGGCPLSLELFRDGTLRNGPDYDWFARPNPDPRTGRWWGCKRVLITIVLAPGDSATPNKYGLRILADRIDAHSLAPGAYTVVARMNFLQPSVPVRVKAGTVQLNK